MHAGYAQTKRGTPVLMLVTLDFSQRCWEVNWRNSRNVYLFSYLKQAIAVILVDKMEEVLQVVALVLKRIRLKAWGTRIWGYLNGFAPIVALEHILTWPIFHCSKFLSNIIVTHQINEPITQLLKGAQSFTKLARERTKTYQHTKFKNQQNWPRKEVMRHGQ